MEMNCLRCGRETANQQVFCDNCLDDMSRHPVKSDTPIHLPVRKPKEPQRKQPRRRKKDLSPEEQVFILRRHIRGLIAAVVVLTLLLASSVGLIYLAWQYDPNTNIGQNYQTADTSNSSITGE